ncbi:hypothetical protein [Brevibacterium casei]|uniref:hypothetical protein n=1 Tax=Brevibacterium casei TaxID=33889 RepID=UPI0028AAF9FC|nr:hypothetical protein [Brevibacterium casei]
MSAQSNAEAHAREFHWHQGDPELSEEEARLHDLIALRNATTELIRDQRDLLGYYDTDEELFGDEYTVDEIVDIVVGAGLHTDRDDVRDRVLRFIGAETRPSDG